MTSRRYTSRIMLYCYLAEMPAALSPFIMTIKSTAAQIFPLPQGTQELSFYLCPPTKKRIPLRLSLIGLKRLTGLEIVAVIVASAFSMSVGVLLMFLPLD